MITFVDTGGWVAIFDRDDQYHLQAMRIWKTMLSSKARLVTSNFVVSETLTYLARKIRHAYAVETGRKIYESAGLNILRPDLHDEKLALALMSKWADQKIGFVDCLSFSLMRRLRIQSAFSFDRHFTLAGFSVPPAE